ncbi:MAG: hypothetical protein JO306_00750 [Gemmatimonadetes bacterium]|nr:hypothetical protein [Gemmatimonadota bacterium]
MSDLEHFERSLRRVLWELRPYLDTIVVIGGWVPHLYQRYGGFAAWRSRLALTAEVDVMTERALPADGRPPLSQLLRESGFEPRARAGGLAVWEGDLMAGEKVEFLVEHRGTALQVGTIVPIVGQPGLGAISLPGLAVMMRFRQPLKIPFATGGPETLDVWVPRLGAYLVNKAQTYAARKSSADGGDSKAGKDLLYIRDVMAAGPEVVRRIEADLAEIATKNREAVRHAASLLHLSLGGAQAELRSAARILAEREPGISFEAAVADMRGHLADACELLDEALRRR